MYRTTTALSFIVGLLFIALAVYYWMTPAGSLPSFFPGYEAGVMAAHFKHGLLALVVGVLLLIFGWFRSARR